MKKRTVVQTIRLWYGIGVLFFLLGGILLMIAQGQKGLPKIMIGTLGVGFVLSYFLILLLKSSCPYCGYGLNIRGMDMITKCPKCGKDLTKPYDTRIRFD